MEAVRVGDEGAVDVIYFISHYLGWLNLGQKFDDIYVTCVSTFFFSGDIAMEEIL